jgi:hypothetical protein
MTWRRERHERLDALMDAHIHAAGRDQRRRWLAAVLSEALFLRLAAEFQGFARDLHDQACGVFSSWVAPENPVAERVVRKQLVHGRSLERGNAHPDSIARDFGRLGFDVWLALAARDSRTESHNRSLRLLNDARNGLAHADEAKLGQVRVEGVAFTFGTCRKWCRELDILADNLDVETAIQLGRLFGRQGPW